MKVILIILLSATFCYSAVYLSKKELQKDRDKFTSLIEGVLNGYDQAIGTSKLPMKGIQDVYFLINRIKVSSNKYIDVDLGYRPKSGGWEIITFKRNLDDSFSLLKYTLSSIAYRRNRSGKLYTLDEYGNTVMVESARRDIFESSDACYDELLKTLIKRTYNYIDQSIYKIKNVEDLKTNFHYFKIKSYVKLQDGPIFWDYKRVYSTNLEGVYLEIQRNDSSYKSFLKKNILIALCISTIFSLLLIYLNKRTKK